MSSYIKATDFASKDSLLTGNPLKIVSGTELDDEFNAIQTAVNTKADTNSPTLTGIPIAPTAVAGTATTQLATTAFVAAVEALVTAGYEAYADAIETSLTSQLQALYPVGSVYINATSATNPATLFGFGTWEAFSEGRVLVGLDSGDTSFDTPLETGGAKTHTLTIGEMPSHDHNFNTSANYSTTDDPPFANVNYLAGDSTTLALNNANSAINTQNYLQNTGGGGAHNNLQPYITVYMWRRTA